MAFFLPFSSLALTSQTTRNAIQGSAPYLTFDGGRTRAVDVNGLLGITLSDGTRYTPSTNTSSSSAPISLPVVGQSFADIRMFVPTDTNSVALSSLIGPPNNYWGDDDGDSGVTATGSLSLSIVDKNNQSVSRNSVLTICKAPYRIKLSSTDGALSTRYGFPNRSTFGTSSETYYVNPKASPVVCFARPNLRYGKRGHDSSHPSWDFAGSSWTWDPAKGFLTRSTDPSSYGRNFPTTGANGLYFDLDISGSSQPLSWSSVSQGGITVTMSRSNATSVRVTLTGPYATESQINSSRPDRVSTPSLPQTFELVGRDNNGTPVVKYGFTLKQWFVSRSFKKGYSPYYSFWCNSIDYRVPRVEDLTNAYCPSTDTTNCWRYPAGAYPYSSGNYYQRIIDAGFFSEWGIMAHYSGGGFSNFWYFTSDVFSTFSHFIVHSDYGNISWHSLNFFEAYTLCAYP
ncbi:MULTISPECIES: hypothetical protein [unclassified Gilliamella]|uniref:hypothetical protein n=1 Tax=unclassified Gilliamella TaxID=2685620 RepID=UPI00226AAFE3|nr:MULTISPECIES: hypothetical protein [unclassified Gilliamella]MCX8670240.1 hypothetical protein [Gilliamella sp. B2785]